MASEMVERVTQAIDLRPGDLRWSAYRPAVSRAPEFLRLTHLPSGIVIEREGERPIAREGLLNELRARLAIMALRDPTEAMELSAGRDNWPSERLAAPSAWRAMIDAALDDAS